MLKKLAIVLLFLMLACLSVACGREEPEPAAAPPQQLAAEQQTEAPPDPPTPAQPTPTEAPDTGSALREFVAATLTAAAAEPAPAQQVAPQQPDPPTATPEPPTPTPALTTQNPEFGPFLTAGQVWEGGFQEAKATYSMLLQIEEVQGASFTGTLHWPELGNSVTRVTGHASAEGGEGTEQSKWAYLRAVTPAGTQAKGVKFTETELLEGSNIALHGWYYAGIQADGTLLGVWFASETAAHPSGVFLLVLQEGKGR